MSRYNIETAKSAGFCFGVKRAVEIAEKTAEENGSCYTLGELIHNGSEIARLQKLGVYPIDSPDDLPQGRTLIIRSHGVAKSVTDYIHDKGISCIDATCPFVAKIHNIVSKSECPVIIAGDPDHPEVIGIVGHCRNPDEVTVVRDSDELEKMAELQKFPRQNALIMVAQTTFNSSKWQSCVQVAKKHYTNITIFDTICSATMRRQQEAESLAAKVDRMIVVGGRHSSNTGKLFDICSRHCPTVWVETAAELRAEDFAGVDTLGITAGASTPARIIKEVQKTMSDILTDDLSFEEMLNLSFKSTYTGEKVTGVVTSVAPNEVAVDIGTKHAGYIPLSELTDDPAAKATDLVQKGDKLDLIVLRVNDVEGYAELSKKRLDAVKIWENIETAVEEKTVLEGTVTEENKGGIVVSVKGVRVFVPASQSGQPRGADLSAMVKQKVQLRITEVNRARRRVVGSIRSVTEEARKAAQAEVWANIEVGKHYTGTVKSMTSYGVFVDIGGVDGMVHISELSWSRIKTPAEVCKVGDTMDVYVISFDPEKKKISLSIRALLAPAADEEDAPVEE